MTDMTFFNQLNFPTSMWLLAPGSTDSLSTHWYSVSQVWAVWRKPPETWEIYGSYKITKIFRKKAFNPIVSLSSVHAIIPCFILLFWFLTGYSRMEPDSRWFTSILLVIIVGASSMTAQGRMSTSILIEYAHKYKKVYVSNVLNKVIVVAWYREWDRCSLKEN